MPDMLVKLYDKKQDMSVCVEEGVSIKRAMALDKNAIVDFVKSNFGNNWEAECERAIFNSPPSCYIAVKDKKIIGFACYDATALGYLGPVGVLPEERKKGLGKMLLNKCLQSMKEKGYGYAVIGFVGPVEYYSQHFNAVVIEGSSPEVSVYNNLTWVEE